MRNFILVAALLGGCTGGSSPNDHANNGEVGNNPDTTPDDEKELGFVEATVTVLGAEEPCQANFLVGSDVIGMDYTGDGEATEIAVGTYEVMAGVSLDTLFSNSDELAEIEDLVDGWNLHPDEKGNLWIAPIQSVTVEVGQTKAVSIEMNLVPTFGPWTCEGDGGLGGYNEDGFEIDDGHILQDMPGLPDMEMEGNLLFHESLEGAYVVNGHFENSDLIYASGVYDGNEFEIWCWAGDEGDDPR
ncbi:hypothetical protein EBT31_00925 [bacterium]|nr:hypothetical protein [bacterium]